jgi:PAS domain S-box-containing protein
MAPVDRQVGQSLEAWVKAGNVRHMNNEPLEMGEHPAVRAMLGYDVPEELYLINGQSGPNTVFGATSAPVRNATGRVVGAVVVIRDVTQHHEMQAKIEEQNALLDTFVRNVPIGLAFLDMSGKATIVNGAIAEMIGVPAERAIGKRPSAAWPTEGGKLAEETVNQVLASGSPASWNEYPFCLPEERYFDAQFTPVRRSNGEMIGVGIVAVEVTEQVKARRILQISYEREHQIAEALQTGLLGHIPSKIACFEFETIYKAATEETRIGGDFYDVFPVDDGKIGIVIGDVSGKGLRAAVQMAMAKYSLRGTSCDSESPAVMLSMLNKAFAMDSDEDSFVTVFVGILDHRRRTLTYANGGHEPVLMWHEAERTITQLEPTGPIVGMIDAADYTESVIKINRGDEILLATDGLVEVKCEDGFLDLVGLIDIYGSRKARGEMSTKELVSHIDSLRITSQRDDTAVMRVIVSD